MIVLFRFLKTHHLTLNFPPYFILPLLSNMYLYKSIITINIDHLFPATDTHPRILDQ